MHKGEINKHKNNLQRRPDLSIGQFKVLEASSKYSGITNLFV
jgi:hypothetical protein